MTAAEKLIALLKKWPVGAAESAMADREALAEWVQSVERRLSLIPDAELRLKVLGGG